MPGYRALLVGGLLTILAFPVQAIAARSSSRGVDEAGFVRIGGLSG